MSKGHEDEIDQWIFQDGVKNLRRRDETVPSADHTPAGTGLDAMEKVAFHLGDLPDLPVVELGQITERHITLTFSADVELEPPFWQVAADHGDQWAITHEDALGLVTGNVHGHQTMALTAIGRSASGAKMLFNTNRWHMLGSVGLARFTTSLMIGQVMEQATEPWSRQHHLWLVGYRELGQKLVSFLAPYHDESHFHLVDSLDQVTPSDLMGTSATIYVMGSSPASAEAQERLRSCTVGLITDTVVTEEAMFISEDEDGGATVVNAGLYGLRIWPNLVGEGDSLYEAMESAWSARQNTPRASRVLAEAPAVQEDISSNAASEEAHIDTSSISVEALQALMDRESFRPEHELEREDPGPEPAEAAVEYAVSLFGTPQVQGSDGSVTEGKPAEAVAYLVLHGSSAKATALARALWPATEPGGRGAHTRRTRMMNTLEGILPGVFKGGVTWEIDQLPTDVEGVLSALKNCTDPHEVLEASSRIDTPLQGCGEWADQYRDRIMRRLRQALEEITDTALENDQFEMAKTARQVYKTL